MLLPLVRLDVTMFTGVYMPTLSSKNSLFLSSSFPLPSHLCSSPCLASWHTHFRHPKNLSCCRHRALPLSISVLSAPSPYSRGGHLPLFFSAVPSDEGGVPVMNFEDFVEKDWSFLDPDVSNTRQYNHNIDRIISAAEIEEGSRVLVSIGSDGFVDRLVEASPCQLLVVVHDSLFLLAGIKERYDEVKCWQGELIYVPKKWAPLDAVFLFFLPALPFKLEQIFEELVKRCSQGARLVISHPQGRGELELQRKQFPDAIVSDLPEKIALQKAAAAHSLEITEYVDEPGFYLAVLKVL